MFADIINQIAKQGQRERGPYRSRPSSAGPDRCIRSLTYAALGVPAVPLPGRALLAMDSSSWDESLTLDWVRKSVLQVHSGQLPIDVPSPGLNPEGFFCEVCEKDVAPEILHGHIDGIITDPLGRDYLLEHKSFSTYQCDRLESELPMDNLTQCVIYSKGLQLLQPGLDQIILLIKNKNTAQYIEFECTYKEATDELIVHRRIISFGDAPAKIDQLGIVCRDLYKNAVEKFALVGRFAKEKELPKRPFPLGTQFPCGYCGYQKKCFENYVAEINELSTDIALSEEIETSARYYKELSAQITELEKQKEDVRKYIRQTMDDLGARTGRAGEYEIVITVTEREKIDRDLVPAEAVSMVPSERMNIKRLKKGGL